MANPGENGPLDARPTAKSADEESRPTPGTSESADAASPPKKPPPGASLKDMPALRPRKQTMMGIGAVKPPAGPIPSPLSGNGISAAMQRPAPPKPKAPPPAPSPKPETSPSPAPLPEPTPEAAKEVAEAKPANAPAPAAAPPEKKRAEPVAVEVASDALEEEAADKAYVSPRPVPKAALPSNEEAAKVVINLPDAPVVDDVVLAKKVEQETARQRRREPTVRIPRATVDLARSEIAAREARLNQEEQAAFGVPLPAASSAAVDVDVAPIAEEPKRGSRAGLFVVALGVLAAGAAGAWYFTRSAAAPQSSVASNADTPAKTAAAATPTETKTVAPPLELTADPPAKSADPSVVTLNAAAADAPAPAAPTGDAAGHAPQPPNVAMNGTWHPAAPGTQPLPAQTIPRAPVAPQTQQPPAVKPAAATPKGGFTPSSI